MIHPYEGKPQQADEHLFRDDKGLGFYVRAYDRQVAELQFNLWKKNPIEVAWIRRAP